MLNFVCDNIDGLCLFFFSGINNSSRRFLISISILEKFFEISFVFLGLFLLLISFSNKL